MEKMRICEFYYGRNILITGATGFMGKVLLEKLLRSCSDIGNIYILIRPKRGKTLQDRLERLFNDSLYDRLKEEQPGIINRKVKLLEGDIELLELGLSYEDKQTIIENVSVIFHIAASVRFDDNLKDAIIVNVRGAREAAKLAVEAKNISILVHVSTAYSNCDVFDIDEKMYPAKMDWKKAIDIAENCDEMVLKFLTEKVIDDMPNTYTYTKALGEHCVTEVCADKVPLLIVRPTIVVSTLREPIKGWIDNFNGPVGILIAYGKGILRTTYCSKTCKPDYIPVDVLVKSMIVASWSTALKRDTTNPEIIHAGSYKYDWIRVSNHRLAKICVSQSAKIPLNDTVWTINGHTSNTKLEFYIRMLIFHLFPAVILDAIVKMRGKKPLLVNIIRRIYIAQMAVQHFMNNEWTFHNKNFLSMQEKILLQDQKDFNFDFESYDYCRFVADSILGARRYLLKEMDDTLPRAQQYRKRIYTADTILKIIAYIVLFAIAVKIDLLNVAAKKIEDIFLNIIN